MANKYIIGSLLFLNSARIKLFKRHITIKTNSIFIHPNVGTNQKPDAKVPTILPIVPSA